MPPRQKISKEMILDTAYELTRENGIDAVNSRSLASLLNCSTQPIFSQFPTMESLRINVHDYACAKFENEVLKSKDSDNFFRESYLSVISLAKNETNIFRLIYLSEYCLGKEFMETRMAYESNKLLFNEIKKRYKLDDNASRDILQRISLLVQGIATVIATTKFHYTNEQVVDIVEKTLDDMFLGYKERR